jgi:hypothetical protein
VVILRYCYGIGRRAAGLMPAWERNLLIRGGEQLLGIDEASQGAGELGLTPDEYRIITGAA